MLSPSCHLKEAYATPTATAMRFRGSRVNERRRIRASLSVKKFVQTLVNGVSNALVSLPSPWWARKLSLNSLIIIVLSSLEVVTDLLFYFNCCQLPSM